MKKEIVDVLEAQDFVNSLLEHGKYVVDVQEKKDNGGYLIQWQEHKTYKAHDGREFRDEIWLTQDGRLFQVQDLSEEHCRNILRMILRQDRETQQHMDSLTDHLTDTYQQGGLIVDEDSEKPPTLH